ncbi:hypothetical protein HQ520_03580, partial [bacterium]|nr:hypothetical protein [bacterium]
MRTKVWLMSALLSVSACVLLADEPVRDAAVLIEAEDFQFRGGWWLLSEGQARGGQVLWVFVQSEEGKTPPPIEDAMTVVELPQAGLYHLWVRSRDYARNQPGTRRFILLLDGQPADEESGDHGQEGFYWERVGDRQLEAGRHMLALHDTTQFHARADSVLLTTTDLDPRAVSDSDLSVYGQKPLHVQVETPGADACSLPPLARGGVTHLLARLENDLLRVRFNSVTGSAGGERIQQTAVIRAGDEWLPVTDFDANGCLFVLYDDSKESPAWYRDEWYPPQWKTREVDIRLNEGGPVYTVKTASHPFLAGDIDPLIPRQAVQTDANTVQVTYRSPSGQEAAGRWSLENGARELRFSLSLTPRRDGWYSVGMCAFQEKAPKDVEFVELPPLHQFQRLPEQPLLVTSSHTPHPLSLMQVKEAGWSNRPLTFCVVAEPANLSWDWATVRNARYGFTITNAR